MQAITQFPDGSTINLKSTRKNKANKAFYDNTDYFPKQSHFKYDSARELYRIKQKESSDFYMFINNLQTEKNQNLAISGINDTQNISNS